MRVIASIQRPRMRGAEKAVCEAYKCTESTPQRLCNDAGGAYQCSSIGDLLGDFIDIACSHRDDEEAVVVRKQFFADAVEGIERK